MHVIDMQVKMLSLLVDMQTGTRVYHAPYNRCPGMMCCALLWLLSVFMSQCTSEVSMEYIDQINSLLSDQVLQKPVFVTIINGHWDIVLTYSSDCYFCIYSYPWAVSVLGPYLRVLDWTCFHVFYEKKLNLTLDDLVR